MMRKPALVTLLFILFLVGGLASRSPTSGGQGGRCRLVVSNGSGKVFNRLHVSWSRDKDWGPNLLREALRPGMSFARGDMVPADYDLLLVDSDEKQCTLSGVRVYSDTTFTITEDLLSNRCNRN